MEFLKNKSVTDPDELNALFRGIDEVDEMLRFNVVQGALNENGNYGMTYQKHLLFLTRPFTNRIYFCSKQELASLQSTS